VDADQKNQSGLYCEKKKKNCFQLDPESDGGFPTKPLRTFIN
jgi:hypothetical protein